MEPPERPEPADAVRAAALLRAVLDSVSDCYYALDRDWTIVEFSRSSELYFGLKREDVIGRNLWELFPSGRDQPYEETCRLAMDKGERGRLEVPSAFRRGHVVEMRTAPMENGISVVITDITERRRAEAELTELTRSLEERIHQAVSEREDALTQLHEARETLFQAQKMDAVGQLAGGIAHDFNNLLQGIIGSLNLIQRRLADGKTAEIGRFAEAGLDAANRAAGLTHRLLAYSRRQPLDPKVVSPGAIVVSMEDLLRRTLGEAIALEVLVSDDLWRTICDPNQFENALLNLAVNARDAMPEGGRLTIEFRNTAIDERSLRRGLALEPGDYVCLIVTDTGSGMPKEVLDRAFDPFFTTKPLGQGTGLGLSMIYGFAKQSRGAATISSQEGRGTIVKLYLPRSDDALAPPSKAAADNAARGAGETILVVEDEATVRDLIVDVLGELGYRVLAAEDGPSGIAMLQSGDAIDLLLTDIGLPGINGREVAAAARRGRPGLKILLMTGYAGAPAQAAAGLGEGVALLTKPFAIEALATRVRALLQN